MVGPRLLGLPLFGPRLMAPRLMGSRLVGSRLLGPRLFHRRLFHRRLFGFWLLGACLFGAALAGWSQAVQTGSRFTTLDIYLETTAPLAAWQFELRESAGRMRVVGVENGDSAAFGEAPYYDLAAVSGGAADRIVVADYSMRPAAELPTGRSRVATIHIQLEGAAEPDYVLSLMAAGGADGGPIQAAIDFDIP